MVYNPVVTAIADIANVTKEVVYLNPISGLRIGGEAEYIADKLVYTEAHVAFERSDIPRPLEIAATIAVRLSFDVVPKDGSPKSRIVKTFIANQVVQ